MKKIENKEDIKQYLQDEDSHYLVFRKFNDNYYIEYSSNKLPKNRTPADSLVCDIKESWDQVCKDKLVTHKLPAKLPSYIIEGFKKRLKYETIISLHSKYYTFRKKQGGHLGDKKLDSMLKDQTSKAKTKIYEMIDSFTKIEDFFKFAILLQKNNALDIYWSDLFNK